MAFQDFTDPDPACQSPPSPMRPYDDLGHGTHVAATMAGTGEGNARFRGIAPGAALVVLKVFDCHNSTATSVIDAALDWAITNRGRRGRPLEDCRHGGAQVTPPDRSGTVGPGRGRGRAARRCERAPPGPRGRRRGRPLSLKQRAPPRR